MADVAFDVDAGHLYDMSKAFAEKGESSLTLVAEEIDDSGVPGYYPIALVTTAWCDAQPAAPTLTDLENVTACSTGYQKTAGWKASVGTLIAEGIIPPVIDGNSEVPNDLLSAEAFFGEGCVPGAIDFFKSDGHEEEGHDDHGHGASCACVAEAANWTLDCSSVAPVSAAMAYLQANCNETMVADMIEGEPDEEACHQNYMLMQAHHDFCPHSSLPPAFEAAMHDFEELFEDCHIDRQFDPALAVCTKIDCADSDAPLKSIGTLQASCTEDCSSDECVKAFQTVLMAHDTCDEDLLPITLEKALHDFEEVCEDALCNSVEEAFQPVCEEEEEEHSEEEEEHVALCEACAGQGDAFCEKVDGEPYYDYDGALRCLAEGAGGVAFVKHSTAETFLSNPDPSWTFADPPTADLDDYRILCYTPGNPSAGGCVPVDQWAGCSFPQKPPHTVVARDETPAVAAFEQALAYLSANDTVFQETFLEGGTMAGTLFSDDIAVIAGVEESVDEYAGSMFSSWQALDDLNAGLSQKSGGE